MLRRAAGVWATLFLIAGAGGCATTQGDKTPEQIALEKEYNQQEAKVKAIKKTEASFKKKAKTLFSKATALEKKTGLAGKKSMAVVPSGKTLPGAGLKIGPVKLDKKKASFNLKEGSSKKVKKGALHPFKFSQLK